LRSGIRPRVDNRALYDVLVSGATLNGLLVAHDLKLFRFLSQGAATIAEVAGALRIDLRPAEILLRLCAALGLLIEQAGRFALTTLAEDYLLEGSPTYFGPMLDLAIQTSTLQTFPAFKRAALKNVPEAYAGGDIFESEAGQAALAGPFTRAMHSTSVAPAQVWPDLFDLSQHRMLLDVGGGSGAHAIGAALRWPALQGVVLDCVPACQVARELIAEQGLQNRIGVHPADFWVDVLPPADLHFYSQIFHDWPPEKCRLLARKSFDSLTPGGRIIVHDMLLEETTARPLAAAAFSVVMLFWTQGKQYSFEELAAMLADAGFVDIEMKPAFGYFSVVAGRKP
jgi:hypothetical protein